MKKREALNLVKPHLTEQRFLHTERVTETALDLAARFHVDAQKAMLGAVFHDYCKYRNLEEMKQVILQSALPDLLLEFHHELWHGPVASILVKSELGIDDDAVLSAIYWHTTGHAEMTTLEKIVYLADYIEPGREIPGIDKIRTIAKSDLDEAVFHAVRNQMLYLIGKSRKVYPETLNLYNALV
ncbi:putative HD superfamily hydrolase involved in NAD metabolism [Streptohalobacillus salinus]|uniref:bis(5'-nucleosyl)-tetraphosphatase (symmetrical) n=1 Tax=Streptohalobacillus salinus TaxID=621096 RepID=A0A2V3WEM7_9BACI|nr:bis(5'-nucleosyl)-tetraphosphatase (symmetrical) YqeK [Streptohalobacillus salinus]PXW91601.1 putative HD superfamily hydrolase involved in NAD metabolism [Streptohalobacillus salinus]